MPSTSKRGNPARVVLIHAYSRANSGDGLLVDEATALVLEAAPDAVVDLVALDPGSFPEHPTAVHPIYGYNGTRSLPALLRSAIRGRPHADVSALYASADLIVAVGGGYLRADGASGFFKTMLAHLSQIPSGSVSAPFIYLPQSIGPFPFLTPRLNRLKKAEAVFVRDDRSLALLNKRGMNGLRQPDLATLGVRSKNPSSSTGSGEVGLIARKLNNRVGTYTRELMELKRLTDARLLVQSTGRGNDDPAFYNDLGFDGIFPTLQQQLLSEARPSVVISVRLHGSLQSLRAGVPTIHLSYERKGWGAFEDLGLSEYVHNARNFSAERVAEQALNLRETSAAYWRAVAGREGQLEQSSRLIVERIQSALAA
ncbi:polysaccharide pyruvyl transferase family protein [Curtobacterium sp. MMLR14_010]|uniref:polysaccharide pyruvyl transferase family protein n=1 Tax=Curtobacterium sp. MMLR14_010 TaxID=1898743 RepID=UPI00158718DC|nr:polysaccharide pyruvyl transferase family protein [Curtobacterium sp. MMLR14_010]